MAWFQVMEAANTTPLLPLPPPQVTYIGTSMPLAIFTCVFFGATGVKVRCWDEWKRVAQNLLCGWSLEPPVIVIVQQYPPRWSLEPPASQGFPRTTQSTGFTSLKKHEDCWSPKKTQGSCVETGRCLGESLLPGLWEQWKSFLGKHLFNAAWSACHSDAVH